MSTLDLINSNINNDNSLSSIIPTNSSKSMRLDNIKNRVKINDSNDNISPIKINKFKSQKSKKEINKSQNNSIIINKNPFESGKNYQTIVPVKEIIKENNVIKHPIFKTKDQIINEKKLIMNRVSAKKSREKKKEYINYLENEIERLNTIKNNNILLGKKTQNKILDDKCEDGYLQNLNLINQIENKMTEKKESKNSIDNNLYIITQKKLLFDIFQKQIRFLMPIKLRLFCEKYLKLNSLNGDEDCKEILEKIEQNINL